MMIENLMTYPDKLGSYLSSIIHKIELWEALTSSWLNYDG